MSTCGVCAGSGKVAYGEPCPWCQPPTGPMDDAAELADFHAGNGQGQRDRQGQEMSPKLGPSDQGGYDDRDRGDSRDSVGRRTSWTAAELLATDFPEPTWAVDGLVPDGLAFLVGAPKVGKSWLGLGLGVSVASGGVALGKIEVEQGPALYLGLEDTPRRLKDRLRKIIPNRDAPKDLTISVECEPMAQGGRERIGRWLAEHPSARLVVVDVLARVRSSPPPGDSMYAADYRAAAVLKALSDDAGVPFLVLHHPRKMAAEDFVDAVSGTAGLAGAADSIALLKRTRGKADGILSVTGRDIDEAEYALRFAADLGAWQLTDTPVSELRRTDTENAVLRWLADNEGAGPKATAEGAELDYETAKKAMRRMAKKGTLDSDGHGHYWARAGADQ